MKKYGKKWRTLHPEFANKPYAKNWKQLKEQEKKKMRQTPMDKTTIENLRQKAYEILPVYQKQEDKDRLLWDQKKETAPSEVESIQISKKDLFSILVEHPIIFSPLYRETFTPPNLKSILEHSASEFIRNVNTIFGISVSNISAYLFCVYDIETHGIEPIGEFYIDTLCEVLEGSTWYTRKQSDWLFAEIEKAVVKSEFIKKYRGSEDHAN